METLKEEGATLEIIINEALASSAVRKNKSDKFKLASFFLNCVTAALLLVIVYGQIIAKNERSHIMQRLDTLDQKNK